MVIGNRSVAEPSRRGVALRVADQPGDDAMNRVQVWDVNRRDAQCRGRCNTLDVEIPIGPCHLHGSRECRHFVVGLAIDHLLSIGRSS